MKYQTFQEFKDAVLAEHDEYDLRETWRIGGQGGGSCWDEGPANHYAIEGAPEPELKVLDDIIELAIPDLTFREYKVLIKADVVKRSEEHENEYYGNWTKTGTKEVDLDALWRALQDVMCDREEQAEALRAGEER